MNRGLLVLTAIVSIGRITEAQMLLSCAGKIQVEGSGSAKYLLTQTEKPSRKDRGQFWIKTFDEPTGRYSNFNYLLQDETKFEFQITQGTTDGVIAQTVKPMALMSKKFIMDNDYFCLVDEKDKCWVVVGRDCGVVRYGSCGYYPSSGILADLSGDRRTCFQTKVSKLDEGYPILR
jgi:hypothetical protein